MAVRVMLVDDHAVFREGLRRLLELGGEFEVVAEAGTAQEALRRVRDCSPHMVLMDLGLPDMDGVEAVSELRRVAPGVSVIVLTMYEDDRLALEVLGAGATAYLVKTATYEEVLRALHAVGEGGSVVSPQVAKRVFSRLGGGSGDRPRAPVLTERERELLRRLCRGESNREMARKMHMSESAVKAQLRELYRKLGARNRAHAVSRALAMSEHVRSGSQNLS